MLQPSKSNKRKSVATTQYDQQFIVPPLEGFPLIEVPDAVDIDSPIGLISGEEFEAYSKQGVDYFQGLDIQKQLAEKQGTVDKMVNVLFRGGIGAAVAAVEPFAYLIDVENHIKALRGADRDYSNFLTRGLEGIEDWARETAPIYVPEDQPGILSADWWFQNTDQVLRSIGYLVPGAALYKGASVLGKGIFGGVANAAGSSISGVAAAKALEAGSALGSATLLNYGEHAVSAARHIEENLPILTEKYVKDGIPREQAEVQAKSELSKQAADIVAGGRANILWQSISQANLFRGIGHSRRFGILKEGTKGQGMREGLKRLGLEAFTEAAEEVTTGYYESEAQYKVDRTLDRIAGEYRPGFEKYIEHLTSYEGITEGLLGALGAVGMTTGASVIEKKNNIDALEQVKKTETELGASGERIKNLTKKQVREHALMNALKGTSANFMEVLEKYKNATPEEAKDLGLEENYKELAEEYMEDAKFIEDVINNELMNPFRNNQAEAFILVNHKLNEYYALQDIENYKGKIAELEEKKQKLFTDIENNVEDKGLHAIRNLGIKRNAINKAIEMLEENIKNLQALPIPMMTLENNETLQGEIKNLADAQEKLKEVTKELEENITDYTTVNEKTFDEVLEEVSKLESAGDIDAEIEAYTAALEVAKIRRKNNIDEYEEYVTDPAKLKKEGEEVIKQQQEQEKERERIKKEKAANKKATEEKNAKEKVKKNKETLKTTQANSAQQAAGGATLTADSPIPGTQPEIVPVSQEDSKKRLDSISKRIVLNEQETEYSMTHVTANEDGSSIKTNAMRVSTAIEMAFPNEKFNGNSAEYEINREWGNQVDAIAEAVINGTKLPETPLLTKAVVNKVVARIKRLQRQNPNSTILSQVKIGDIELGVAGAMDIVILRGDGSIDIVDIKTSWNSTQDPSYDKIGPNASKKMKHTRQQSVYKYLLEQNGFKVNSISILPFHLNEITKKNTVAGVRNEPMIDLEYSQETINAVFLSGKVLTSPIFEGDVRNDGSPQAASEQNQENANQVPDTYNGYFENTGTGKERQLKSASSLGFRSINWEAYEALDDEGKPVRRTRSTSNQKTPESKLVESQKDLLAGSEVTLKLINASNVEVTKEELAVMTEEQIDALAVGVFQNGQKKGALHSLAWIQAKDQFGQYINTADSAVEQELAHAKNVRRTLARSEAGEMVTNVAFKGHGIITPLYAEDESGRLLLDGDLPIKENKPVTEALPNFDKLDLAITNGGIIYPGEFGLKEETVMPLNRLNYGDGRVVVNLPAPNSKIFPTILFIENVPEQQAETIIGAATSYQNNEADTYAAIEQNTGIRFGRQGEAEGLHKFVNRYIYSPKVFYRQDVEQEKHMDQRSVLVFTPRMKAGAQGQVQGIMQIIDLDNRAMYTNDPAYFNEVNPGYLKENGIETVYDLREEDNAAKGIELLQRKLVSVKRDMINKKESFVDVILDRTGKVKDVSEHSTYNAFKAQHLKTDINGKNFIEDEDGNREYTYMAQPLVSIDTSFAEEGALVEEAEETNIEENIFLTSPVLDDGNLDERAVDNLQVNDITEALSEELKERFFDYKIIPLKQQLEAVNAFFGIYAKAISKNKFKDISAIIKKELQKIVDTKQTRKNKKAAVQHLLDNYDLKAGKVTVEGLLLEKFSKLDILPQKDGFIAKDLTDVEIDQMYNEMLEADGFTQEDFVKDIYDFEFYKTNKKRTASSGVKLFLSTISTSKTSWLGGPFKEAVEYQEMYDTLKATLSGVPGTFADQKAAIQKKAKEFNSPIFTKVLRALEGANQITLQRQFVVAMSGTRLEFVFLKTDTTTLGATSKVMEVDRYNTTINVKNKWFRNMLEGPLTKVINVNGIQETVVDQKQLQKVRDRYTERYNEYKKANKLSSPEFVGIVKDLLADMGIQVPFEGLMYLATKASSSDRITYLRRDAHWATHVDPSYKGKGMISNLFNSFRSKETEEAQKNLEKLQTNLITAEEASKNAEANEAIIQAEQNGGFIYANNPYDGPSYEKVIYGLLNLNLDFKGSVYGDSFFDIFGNMIYPYQNYFGLKRLHDDYTTNKKNLSDLLKLSYSKNSVWGNALLQDPNYLEIVMFDGTNLNGNATSRKQQGRFLQELTLFNLFANQGNKTAYFMPITTADKDVSPAIKAPKLGDIVPDLVFEGDQLSDIKSGSIDQIIGYAIAEYERIKNHRQQESFDRGAYEEGANYFYMFDYLNPYEGNPDVMAMSEEEALEYIASTVKQNVINQITSHVARLQSLGLSQKFLDAGYFRKVIFPQEAILDTKEKQFIAAIADFNLNYIVSNNETVKLFGNDPAHTYKRSKKPNATLKDHIKESLNNYEKRKADLISPASTPQYTSPVVTIVTAEDAIRDGIERTDAQEYGTIREMLESKLSAGKLPKEIVDRILEAHEAAIADPSNLNNFFKLSDVLSKKEIDKYKKIMMADKPVFVQNDIQVDQDSNNKLFRKSSIRYLWPEETTGYGMDNIRVAMENVGIDRLGHESSDKSGAVKVVSIYDENGNVKSLEEVTAALKQGSRTLSRLGLGIQQEKGADTGEISYSTQLDILLFDDMLGKTLSTGEKVSDLRDQKEQLIIKIMQLGAQRLTKKLGIVKKGDTLYIPNPTTLAKMLKEEAISRKWSAKDISELALKDMTGAIERVFKSPLTFNHARKNIDALVLSLINKEITKIKIPGEALVQASSAGFESNGAVSWQELRATMPKEEFDKLKSGITLIKGDNQLDETVGLQGTRIVNGKVLGAQILISPIFTDPKTGKTIDLTSKKYTGVDNGVRYLRTDVLPQELRERILYRIPGQGKPSVSAVEIVGFLPKTSTSSIIVPDALIDQMGSDFDWDTAYTYFQQYDVKQDGRVQIKSKFTELEKLQNQYYKLLKKMIFDPVTVRATDKLDNIDLKTSADVVDAIVGKEAEINSPSYVTTNIDNTISQRTGKQLIGPASLAAVMHAALQGKGITINVSSKTLQPIPFTFFEGGQVSEEFPNGKPLNLTSISGYRGKSYPTDRLADAIRTASDNNRTVQNAAVDNANEAVLGRAGINNATVDVALFTLMYKDQKTEDSIHVEQLVYFLRQEAIELYSEQFDYYSAQIEGGFRSEEQIRNDAFNATMTKLAEKAGITPEPDYTTNLSEYRKDNEGRFLTFSSENFLKQLQTSNNPNPSYYKTQMAILAGFKQLQNSSDPIRKLQRGIMSPRTKGMGSTIFEAQRTIDNMEEIFNKGLSGIGGLENLEGGQLKEIYLQFRDVYSSLSSILPFSNPHHKELVNLWQSFTGVRNVSQATREQLFNAMLNKSYARAFETAFGEDILDARLRLMLSENNIAERVIELQKTEFGKRNLFISRLIPMLPNRGVPATISYISSKQDDIADRMSIDFVEMYMSPEPGVRELFEDIVKYTYLTGGVQSAGNFSKFMPPAYLDKVGFYDALRQEELALQTKNSVSAPSSMETMVEFFQHNPHRTVTLENKQFNEIAESPITKVPFGGKNLSFEFVLKQPKSEASFDSVTYEDEDGNRKYLDIISLRGPSLDLELYRKIGTNENGSVIFRRIGKKGFSAQNYSKINEYGGLNKFTEDGRLVTEFSIMHSNNVPLAEGLNVGVPELTSNQPTVPVTNSVYGFDTLSATYPTKGRKGVKDLLAAVIENTQDESYKKLASILLDNIDTNGTAIKQIEATEGLTVNDKKVYGGYDPVKGVIKIDLETLTRRQDKLDDTILHEMIHGFLFEEIANKDSKFGKNIVRLTRAAKAAFNKAVKAGEIEKGSTQYEELNFAFSSPQEFVTKTMTEPIVQSFLNDVQGKRNMWERFKQLVRDFLESLGLDIKKDSLLAESVNAILDHVTQSTPSTTKVQEVVKRAAGELPWDTSIPLITHWTKGQERVKNGEYTMDQFNEALQTYKDNTSTLTSPMLQGETDTKDEFITVFEERARRLRNKITAKVLQTPKGKQMQERLNQYEDQIRDLKRSKGYAILETVISNQLGFARKIATKNKTPNPTAVEIKEALNIVDMYNYDLVTSDYIGPADRRPGNVWNEMLLRVSKDASAVKSQLLDRLYEVAAEQINAGLPEETITAEDLKVMGEEKYIKTNFLDLSKFKHPLVRTLDAHLKKANRGADSAIDLLFTKIESQISEIENHPQFKRDPNLFFQRDENGKLSGYFISPYSDKFRRTRNDIFKKYYAENRKAKTEAGRQRAATKLLNNLNKIEIAIDLRWFVPGMEAFQSDFTSKEDYISYLDEQLGEKRRKALVFKALRGYVKYKRLEDQKMMDIELEVSGAAGDIRDLQQEIKSRQEAFRERYSPIYNLNYRYGKTRVSPKNTGWKFLTTAPVKNRQFYDSRYTAIENDPQLKKFHDFYISTMKDLLKFLPEGLVATLPENFFPYAKRGFMEQLNAEGITSMFAGMNSTKGVKNKIADYLFNIDQEVTLDPQVATRGVRDPKTGKLEKDVPVRMLRGKADEKSYDIRKVMQMFGAMSIAYDYKSQVEDKILLLQRLVREAKELQMDSKGDPMYKKVQRKLKLDTDSDGLSNVKAAVDYAIDSGLYGVNKDTIEKGVVFSKQVADIKQRFEILKENKEFGNIDASEYLAEKAKLDEEMKKLGKKPKSLKKPIERLIEYTQLKGLGWNLMSGVNNLSFGTIANYTHAAGKEDYTPKQLMQGYQYCFSQMGKVAALAQKYGVLFEQLDTYYGKRKQKKYNFVQYIDPFVLQTKTEYMNQIAPFIAKMLNTKVADGVTLFDMYDNEGNIKPEYSELESEWTTKIDAETENKFTTFRDATIEMNKINHGNYDPNSALLVKKEVWGRVFTQFRTWAFEGINTRWGEKVYNKQLGRWTEGRYKAYGKQGIRGSLNFMLKSLLNMMTLGYAISDEKLRGDIKDDMTFANMRKNMAELKFYIAALGSSMFFKALAEAKEDEGDEDEPLALTANLLTAEQLYRLVINTIYRAEQDVEFYSNPKTAMEILRNPAAIIKTILDLGLAVDASIDYVKDPDEYEESKRDPLTKKWLKTVPFGNSVRSIQYLAETDLDKD